MRTLKVGTPRIWPTFAALALLFGAPKCPSAHRPDPVLEPYQVRVAYVIPSDRKPQADYQRKAAVLLGRIQTFYADQMEANGFGRMTFNVESNSDGLPDIHLINSPMTAAVFADTGHARYVTGKYWEHAFEAVKGAGFDPHRRGEIWLCFVEAQDQLADGSIHNDSTQGAGSFQNGFALCSGLELAVCGDPELIHDHRKYDGRVIPAFGPHKLGSHVSFPAYQGEDVSSLAADYISATAHELGHCFLLQHCYLNDATTCGNLMGNGFRGWRGYFMPHKFPNEDTRLARPSALILRLNPFLRKTSDLVESGSAPRVEITTEPGRMKLDQHGLTIAFSASEPGGPGIALATLENGQGRDGVGIVAWQEFSGNPKEVKSTISTNMIEAGRDDSWRLTLYDAAGNVSSQSINLKAPETGIAPSPFISVAHSRVKTGTKVSFKGSVRRPWKFIYKWSFGDGVTAEGSSVTHAFSKAGLFKVNLTVIDPGGRSGEIQQYISVSDVDITDK